MNQLWIIESEIRQQDPASEACPPNGPLLGFVLKNTDPREIEGNQGVLTATGNAATLERLREFINGG